MWNGREDNEHLAELVRTMDAGSTTFPIDLAHALAARDAESKPAEVPAMPKPLPTAHAITDMQASRDALLAAHAAGDTQAAATLRRYHPRFADSEDDHVLAASITAEDAELAIAREHGFASWRRLVVHVTRPAGLTDFLQLACQMSRSARVGSSSSMAFARSRLAALSVVA